MNKGLVNRDLLIILGLLVFLNLLFFPAFRTRRIDLKQGDISFEDIIAPFDFSIPKSEEELAQERKELEAKVPKVFYFDLAKIDSVRSHLSFVINQIDSIKSSNATFEQETEGIQEIINLSAVSVNAILSSSRKQIFERSAKLVDKIMIQGYIGDLAITSKIVYIQIGDRELPESFENFYNDKKVKKILRNEQKPVREIVLNLIEPNVTLNGERSNEVLKEALNQLRTTKGIIKKGEMIVGAHKRVTPAVMEKINALNRFYSSYGWKSIINFLLSRNLFFLLLIILLKYYLDIRRREYKEKNIIYFFAFLVITYFGIVKIVSITINNVYAIPIAFIIFFSILYLNLEASFLLTMLFSLTTFILIPELKLLVFLFLSGTAAALIARMIQHRSEFYLNAIIMALINLAIISLSNFSIQPSEHLFADMAWGTIGGFGSSFIVLLLLPLFEKIFSFTTDLTLLELANLNREIFKKLSLEAPGTHHHSVVVGNLAEAGAIAIGANPILARVGAYYHDIGKLKKPEYFSENQLGKRNPHDQLNPEMSKLVIVKHVKEGVEMAKKIGLPAKIIELISEHHGTTVVEPFYLKAMQTKEKASIDDFRYPGPIPSSKEAAIIMLADSVEAAARSADNITVSKLRKIIKDIFDKKFNDHQLDDCEITRKDLLKLQKAFFPILAGVFHPRVDYEDKDIRSRSQQKQDTKK